MMVGLAVSAAGDAIAAPILNGERRTVCVLVPHFKDEYWLSVGYGLEREAHEHDIGLLFLEAGGYRSHRQQLVQLRQCADRRVDAILLGAVSSDNAELISEIERISKRVPVFGLVNELQSEDLSGRIGVDWFDMGEALGSYLAGLHPEDAGEINAVLISGPDESGWVGPLEKGLRDGLDESSITIIEVFSADTGLREQLGAVEAALTAFPDIDLLIGSAPAVEAAIGLINVTGGPPRIQFASTYISHTIKRSVFNGRVLAVPFDDPVAQGEMAIRQVLKFFNTSQRVGLEGPKIRIFSSEGKAGKPIVLSPAQYFPVIQ